MKVLFVSVMSNPLNHPKDGDAQRTRLLLQACAKIAEVDLITFAGKADEKMDGVRVVFDLYIKNCEPRQSRLGKWMKVLPITRKEALFPVNKRYESVVDNIVRSEDYDLIVSRYFHRAMLCGLWKYRDKLAVDFDDSPASLFLNRISGQSSTSMRIRMRLAAKKAQRISRKAIKQMRAAFFSNSSQANENNATYLPNIPFYEGHCSDPVFNPTVKRILFVGQLDYLPNREGVDRFLRNVYLPLCGRIPELEMHIVGSLADDEVRERWQSFPQVSVMGFVDDLLKEYEQAHVVVVPIYQCGGTNIKLLEAMKMNRACVTTVRVIEQLGWMDYHGKAFYAAGNDQDFARYTEALLVDHQLNVKIANQGRDLMNEYYSFNSFSRIVARSLAAATYDL